MRPAGAPRRRDALSGFVLQSTRKMHETRDERISRPNDGKREKGGEGERDGDRTRTFHILLGESQLKTCHAKVVRMRVRGIRISYIFLLPPSNRHLARRCIWERGKRKERAKGYFMHGDFYRWLVS